MTNISTLGTTNLILQQIDTGLQNITSLSTQLSSGKKSFDLSDYSAPQARQLLDFTSTIGRHQNYVDVINTVQPRLKVYDSSLSGLVTVGNTIQQLVNQNQSSTAANSVSTAQQVQDALNSVTYYLNQQVGGRFVFSGSRYNTQPVLSDLSTLPVPPTEVGPTTAPALPAYDTEYVAGASPASASTAATAQQTAKIDDNYSISYGVSSNDPAIQNLVLGLRYAYAATQNPSNYTTYINQARTLITNGLSGIQDLQTHVASNENQANQLLTTHQNVISDLNNQSDTISNADSTTVAAQISSLQSQLQASYTVIGKIASLSLTKFI